MLIVSSCRAMVVIAFMSIVFSLLLTPAALQLTDHCRAARNRPVCALSESKTELK
jgi:hypothetical protein